MEEVDKRTILGKLQEKVDELENRVQLLEIIAKQGLKVSAEPTQTVKKVIQINAKGKRYFCETTQEQQVFSENNPGVKTETFSIELPVADADKYLNDPENKKQFTKKEGSQLCQTQ